ncbi:cyclase family protein [Nocardiopsis sediminis]|uniref:Cyclase family protein n=1 Tax=Nocardiopsis sediminis TaxID=1778267 RepID=A0ABV8FLR3_9ACTN
MRQIDYGTSSGLPVGDANPYVRRTGPNGTVQISGDPEAERRSLASRAFSRRNMFRFSGASGIAAALSMLPAGVAAHADTSGVLSGTVKDLTHTLSPDFPYFYPAMDRPVFEDTHSIGEHGFYSRNVTLGEHVGTHIDAPAHYVEGGATIEEMPVESLVAPLCVLHIADRAAEDPDTVVTVEDIRAHERRYGAIPNGAFVAMDSGWAARVDVPDAFLNEGSDGLFHWPGFSAEAAAYLVERRSIVGAGVDTTGLDQGIAEAPDAHQILLPAGLYLVECLNNLDTVPSRGATIVVGAPKNRGGSGGQVRVFAFA